MPYFAPEAAMPMTSCAPRFAEMKASPQTQAGIARPARKKSVLVFTLRLSRKPIPRTKMKYTSMMAQSMLLRFTVLASIRNLEFPCIAEFARERLSDIARRQRIRGDGFHFRLRRDTDARNLDGGSKGVVWIRVDGFDEYLLSAGRLAYDDIQVGNIFTFAGRVEHWAIHPGQ